MEQRTLRKSSGARCVLQHHGVGRSDLWEIAGELVGSREEIFPVVEANDVMEFGAFGLDALGRGEHRIAAMRWHDEHCLGPRLCEHVLQLVLLERRVDGDNYHAGQRAAELKELPFGNVVRPDGNVAPRLEPVEKRPSCAFGMGEQFRVRPLTTDHPVSERNTLDQRELIGCRCGRFAEQVANREISDRRCGIPDGV